MKFDIHVHSMYSHDSIEKPIKIINKAKKIGLDGIVITEHNSFEASAPWEQYKDTGLVVLRGTEYKTREGHVLVY
jgi:predicted metal-dependent phosphoesterase TrpH